jgi:uncharacterized protein YkwD
MALSDACRTLYLVIALTGLVATGASAQDANPARYPDLAAALQSAGQGKAVLAELEKISPFDEADLSRAYREQRFETLLNLIRAEGGVCDDDGGTHAPNPVRIVSNAQLNDAAFDHAKYLAEERKRIKAAGSPNPHTQTLTDSPLFTGQKMGDRASHAGYTGFNNAESIASGNGNDVAGSSIEMWFNSRAGHCSGLFQSDIDEFGFGAMNYINDEFHNNNEFKSVYMTGRK